MYLPEAKATQVLPFQGNFFPATTVQKINPFNKLFENQSTTSLNNTTHEFTQIAFPCNPQLLAYTPALLYWWSKNRTRAKAQEQSSAPLVSLRSNFAPGNATPLGTPRPGSWVDGSLQTPSGLHPGTVLKAMPMASRGGFTGTERRAGAEMEMFVLLPYPRSPNVLNCNCWNRDDKLFAETLRVRPGAGVSPPLSWALGTHCSDSRGDTNPAAALRSSPTHQCFPSTDSLQCVKSFTFLMQIFAILNLSFKKTFKKKSYKCIHKSPKTSLSSSAIEIHGKKTPWAYSQHKHNQMLRIAVI